MQYNKTWTDMSEYIVHFTKATQLKNAYDNMLSINFKRKLMANKAFGIARKTAPDITSQKAVCFSETPLHLLDRISKCRSRYGIGFTKEYILRRGGAPVWYIEKDSPLHDSLNLLITKALQTKNPKSEAIWNLTPFIDIMGEYPSGKYRFEWEREWRFIGTFNFHESDVAFLIIPEELHSAAHIFFKDAVDGNSGPGYFCPYIDASWKIDKIQDAFKKTIKSQSKQS